MATTEPQASAETALPADFADDTAKVATEQLAAQGEAAMKGYDQEKPFSFNDKRAQEAAGKTANLATDAKLVEKQSEQDAARLAEQPTPPHQENGHGGIG